MKSSQVRRLLAQFDVPKTILGFEDGKDLSAMKTSGDFLKRRHRIVLSNYCFVQILWI